jgi:hypothetical protein
MCNLLLFVKVRLVTAIVKRITDPEATSNQHIIHLRMSSYLLMFVKGI